MNTTSNVTTNATVSTLMSLLNAEYNMNKVADYVHMKESRTNWIDVVVTMDS